jgi:hypothetical protein
LSMSWSRLVSVPFPTLILGSPPREGTSIHSVMECFPHPSLALLSCSCFGRAGVLRDIVLVCAYFDESSIFEGSLHSCGLWVFSIPLMERTKLRSQFLLMPAGLPFQFGRWTPVPRGVPVFLNSVMLISLVSSILFSACLPSLWSSQLFTE